MLTYVIRPLASSLPPCLYLFHYFNTYQISAVRPVLLYWIGTTAYVYKKCIRIPNLLALGSFIVFCISLPIGSHWNNLSTLHHHWQDQVNTNSPSLCSQPFWCLPFSVIPNSRRLVPLPAVFYDGRNVRLQIIGNNRRKISFWLNTLSLNGVMCKRVIRIQGQAVINDAAAQTSAVFFSNGYMINPPNNSFVI